MATTPAAERFRRPQQSEHSFEMEGRYLGEWLAFPLVERSRHARTVYQRRPHYFPEGEKLSFCEGVERVEGMLLYDPERMMTLQSDPMIDRIREHLRPCRSCGNLLAPPSTTEDEIRKWQMQWATR